MFYASHLCLAFETERLVFCVPSVIEFMKIAHTKGLHFDLLPPLLSFIYSNLKSRMDGLREIQLWILVTLELFLSSFSIADGLSVEQAKLISCRFYPPHSASTDNLMHFDEIEDICNSPSFASINFPFIDQLISSLNANRIVPTVVHSTKSNTVNTNLLTRRKIQPKIQVSKQEMQSIQIQKQLRKWFYWKYPSIKEIIQFAGPKLVALLNTSLMPEDDKNAKAAKLANQLREQIKLVLATLTDPLMEPKVLFIAEALALEHVQHLVLEKIGEEELRSTIQ